MGAPLLHIRELTTVFDTGVAGETVRAVDAVDLTLHRGETVGLVGESGCGKTMLALSILNLVPNPPGHVASGSVVFDGIELVGKSEEEMRTIRGNRISMIFQEPMTSLNPVFTVGEQVAEAVRLHQHKSKDESLQAAVQLFKQVGIPSPELRVSSYPHELSGGMRQRVIIAMALACNPELILADEPTTALDVTIQAQILGLMHKLGTDLGVATLLITHDLGVVAQTCSRVIVMYAGQIVEEAPVKDLFDNPLHPYTQGLLASIPRHNGGKVRLTPVPGTVPSLTNLPQGCIFHPRCPKAFDKCTTHRPHLEDKTTRKVRCWLHI